MPFADHLHVTVLDAVVDHFDKVTRSTTTNPIAARFALFGLSADTLEDVFDVRPSVRVSTRHDAGALECAFFTAGNTGSDEQNAFIGKIFGAANTVGELTVATVDDDVAFVQVRQQPVDNHVDWFSSFNHDHDAARALE